MRTANKIGGLRIISDYLKFRVVLYTLKRQGAADWPLECAE